MPSKSAGKSIAKIKRQVTAQTLVSAPEWPPLQPLVPIIDLTLETLLENQIIVIRNLFTSTLCKRYISFLSSLPLTTTPAQPKDGDALRVNDRIQFDDPTFASQLWSSTALEALLGVSEGEGNQGNLIRDQGRKLWGGEVCGLNPRIRVYRYTEGQFFGQHFLLQSLEHFSEPNRTMVLLETVVLHAIQLLNHALSIIRSYLYAVIFGLVTSHICISVIYSVVFRCVIIPEETPRIMYILYVVLRAFLCIFSAFLDIFLYPLSTPEGEIPIPLWPLPFSSWLSVIIAFILWALPDRIAKVAPDVLGDMPDDIVIAEEDLYAIHDESNPVVLPINPPTQAKTTWTLLIYLTGPSTGCVGGETVFYPELGPAKDFSGKSSEGTEPIAVELEVGMALLHKHGQDCLLHEGRKVTSGEKWVIRTDLCVKK